MINNSLKFSKESEKPLIRINAGIISVNERANSKIVVTDNGIGFDPEYNETIFNTFTRLNSKNQYDGTGLGLSLSKKIVERHNGIIEAEGLKDVGATFIITLPVKYYPSHQIF